MNIALVDDMPDELHNMELILKDYAAHSNVDLSLSSYLNAEELLADYRPLLYTVIFLDIYMDGMSGIEAARQIRTLDPDSLIVFLTSSSDHMPEAFSFHAYEYIMKPVSADKVFRVMDDILRRHTETSGKKLFFGRKKGNYSIAYKDIVFIRTGTANYLEIMDKEGRIHKTRMTFSAIGEQIKEDY